MHSEHLQISRRSLKHVLSSTKVIDLGAPPSAQHQTRSHNAQIIVAGITGILSNIDSELSREFACALGLVDQPQTTQVQA